MSKEVATIHDYARMCVTVENCTYCPLKEIDVLDKTCAEVLRMFPDKTNELILKWCEEHPIKTYRQDFLEKFPNASLKSDGSYMVCKRRIYNGEGCSERYHGCKNCWNEPMEVE